MMWMSDHGRFFRATVCTAGMIFALSLHAQTTPGSTPDSTPTPPLRPPSAAEAAGTGTEPTSELRLNVMLGAERVLSEQWNGPVWELRPAPSRRLLQLPLRLTPGSEPTTLGEPDISVAAGRFIAWVLPEEDAATRSFAPQAAAEPTDEALLDLHTLLRRADAQREERTPPPSRPDDAPAASTVPEGAPRLAREITLLPVEGEMTDAMNRGASSGTSASGGGGVAWEVSRVFSGGTVAAGQEPYKLLLDSQRLREMQPQRPERMVREAGEDPRTFNLRRRDVEQVYRDEAEAFRELGQRVRSLPTRFEMGLPPTVWAVYEINTNSGGFTIQRGDQPAWTVRFEDWEMLRSLAGGSFGRGGGGDGQWSADQLRTLTRLTAMARDPQPWNQRMLATAVSRSGLAARATPGDAAFKLLEALLQSPEVAARNRVAYTLATTDPATPAIAALLGDAARQHAEPTIALAALRARLAVDLGAASDPRGARGAGGAGEGLTRAINSANTLLADQTPAAPAADLVIRELLMATAPATTSHGGETSEVDAAIAAGLRFEGLSPPRFDAAVAGLLRAAERRPGAVGAVLNRQLLGSSDAAIVRRSLELLARADAPSPVIQPLARALRQWITTPPPPEASDAAKPPQAAPLDLTLTVGIPLDSANHSLFKYLNSGDPVLRRLGWQVLRHFELTDQAAGGGRSGAGAERDDAALDPLTLIMNAAFSRPDTPASLVRFLVRQPDQARTTEPLLSVVRRGDVSASRRASRALLGSGRELGQALTALSPGDRAMFANRMYDRLGTGPEPVADLLRDDQGPGRQLITWFGKAVSEGALPPAAAWGQEVRDVSELYRLAVGQDDALAHGAIAALTAMAGGDRDLQYRMIDRFKQQRKTLDTAGMGEAWAKARQDIYIGRLAAAAGDYRLTMIVEGRTPREGGAGLPEHEVLGRDAAAQASRDDRARAAGSEAQRVTLGVITLQADGRSLGFSGGTPALSVPEDRLALRIASPSQLKNFPNVELKPLPLEGVTEPLDLLPQDRGAWRGSVTLPDGRTFALLMEPIVKAPKKPEETKPATDAAGG